MQRVRIHDPRELLPDARDSKCSGRLIFVVSHAIGPEADCYGCKNYTKEGGMKPPQGVPCPMRATR